MQDFFFELTPYSPEDCEEPPVIPVTLRLTQRQFENKQLLDRLLEREAATLGISPLAWWHERPPVADELVARIRAAIGCPKEATVIFYYPARITSRHFSSVIVDGATYCYSNFPGSLVIKVVPALPVTARPVPTPQSGAVALPA
ncbi:hypothetical protein [Noviherbaspirillum pedocola]|uniref:Uncharacterized protein n=1 Tax=Noviherbaspirillum pedocola TaxID=2801341 RepID=A0A934SUP6_9BURK|nr:hypothetical protein [Noviherbaspirillum pedocola]MBK4736057.1 hypothetical protein [Noviherbaspirillum pedocola]